MYALCTRNRENIEKYFQLFPKNFVSELYAKYKEKFCVWDENSSESIHTAKFGNASFVEIDYLLPQKNYIECCVYANFNAYTFEFDKKGKLERDCIENFIELFYGGYDAIEKAVKKRRHNKMKEKFNEREYKNAFNKENYTSYNFRIKKDLSAKLEKALLDKNVKKIEVFRLRSLL